MFQQSKTSVPHPRSIWNLNHLNIDRESTEKEYKFRSTSTLTMAHTNPSIYKTTCQWSNVKSSTFSISPWVLVRIITKLFVRQLLYLRYESLTSIMNQSSSRSIYSHSKLSQLGQLRDQVWSTVINTRPNPITVIYQHMK